MTTTIDKPCTDDMSTCATSPIEPEITITTAVPKMMDEESQKTNVPSPAVENSTPPQLHSSCQCAPDSHKGYLEVSSSVETTSNQFGASTTMSRISSSRGSTSCTAADANSNIVVSPSPSNRITLLRANSFPQEWKFCFPFDHYWAFKDLETHEPPTMHEVDKPEDIDKAAREFSDLSDPQTIKKLCQQSIMGWNLVNMDNIKVSQIMAGLTNQLFKVELQEGGDLTSKKLITLPNSRVLFRIYGSSVSELYDPTVELEQYKTLSRVGVAPKLIAEFEGGRIEEWILGPSLLVKDMLNPPVLCGIASIMGRFHGLGKRCPELSRPADNEAACWQNVTKWRAKAMLIFAAASQMAEENVKKSDSDTPVARQLQRMQDKLKLFSSERRAQFLKDLKTLDLETFALESARLPDYCVKGSHVEPSETLEVVFCHNDVQENNILVTDNCLRLIDYEYAAYNHPGFDIANFFWESICDYTKSEYPYFEINQDPAEFASEEHIRLFGAVYLSEYSQNVCLPSNDEKLKPFIKSVMRFVLVSDALWAFWSVIRAGQAATSVDFDYINYAGARIKHYYTWKKHLIEKGYLPA